MKRKSKTLLRLDWKFRVGPALILLTILTFSDCGQVIKKANKRLYSIKVIKTSDIAFPDLILVYCTLHRKSQILNYSKSK